MKILLVEDDKFFQKFYKTQLEEKKYEVEIASDGAEGLDKIRSFRPDMILLDIIMPVKDGFDVLREKSQDKQISAIPVLMFSTLGQDQDIKKALDLGAKAYVNKSFFDFDVLLNKILEIAKK